MCFPVSSSTSPVSQAAPERSREELDEGPRSNQQSALRRVHPHLLEIDPHQGKERSERRVEEEVEGLHCEEFLVDCPEEKLDDIGPSPDLVGRLFRLRVRGRVHFSQSFGVDARPRRPFGCHVETLGVITRTSTRVIHCDLTVTILPLQFLYRYNPTVKISTVSYRSCPVYCGIGS